jgi:hypothetical protein
MGIYFLIYLIKIKIVHILGKFSNLMEFFIFKNPNSMGISYIYPMDIF